jgi:aarF domain-containing kinase
MKYVLHFPSLETVCPYSTDIFLVYNQWAVGFYTELDFLNEADNQQRSRDLIMNQEKVAGIYVPLVYHELSTRRVLVTEWIDGVKLSDCPKHEIRELIGIGQESFLVQLLQVGFFHSDPHPGNLMKMQDRNDPSKNCLVLLDFGLMASIEQDDMDTMVSSIIHLANKNYPALVDDFIDLKILPQDCDRAKVIPLMDKALSPYVKGGGAKKYEAELKKLYNMEDGTLSSTAGGFQAMTQDLLTVLNDIPFSIPPYFALLGRAVVTLEGIALIGDPEYRLVMEAYPFVARKLLKEDRPAAQKALQEVLYASTQSGGSILQGKRLAVMLNSAMGVVARESGEGVFVDLDTIPEDSISLTDGLRYLLSPRASSLRKILEKEAVGAGDVLLRQAARKSGGRLFASLPRAPKLPFELPFFGALLDPENIPGPFLVPTRDLGRNGTPRPCFASPSQVLDAAAPKLTREEELFAISLADLAQGTLGPDAATLLAGDGLLEPAATASLLLSAFATGQLPGSTDGNVLALANAVRSQLAPAGSGVSTVFTVNGASEDLSKNTTETENESLDDVIAAVRDLTPDETAVLQGAATRVAENLWNLVVSRLERELLDGDTTGAVAESNVAASAR